MSKQTYTEKLHAQRLLKMLKREEPCNYCPATKKFVTGQGAPEIWKETSNPCQVCKEFVGLERGGGCPCYLLENPIQVTIQKLEEKGYL